MHTVRCECAVYRPGNCRETPKNLIFQEREKELREEHRRHRRFRDRDDDELRTEDKTMCFATETALRSWEVEKLRSWISRVLGPWKLSYESYKLDKDRPCGPCGPCGTHSRYRPLSRRVPNQSDTLANADFFFPFFHFFIELKIMVSIFWKTEFQSFGVDLCLSFSDWNLETLKPWRSTRQVRWDAFAVKPWNLFSL